MRFISFTADRQETAKTLIFLLLMFALIAQMAAPAAAEVTKWDISPEKPIVGDTIKIRGNADPNEETEVLVSFEKEAVVSGGNYEYQLNDVVIPGGFDNRFTVEAEGAEDLNVRVKMLLWITKSSEASGGTAIVAQSRVPPGTYPIKIDGKAKGASVNLKIAALQRIEADSDGKLSYSYNTKSVPPGKFEIKLGGVTKEITLSTRDTTAPEEEKEEPIPSPATQPPKVTPEALEENTPAENESNREEEATTPSKEETIRKENIFKDKINQEPLTEDKGASTVEAEGKEDKKEKAYYTIGGIASALIILFAYSRIKKIGKI